MLLETDENDGFRVTSQMIERLITPRTKLIILNSPSNPSGAVMSPEDLAEVVRLATERGIWVISDECYVYLNYTGKRFSVGALRDYRDRMVIIGSLSKTYAMTGWRLGYALAPAAVTSAMQKLQSQSTSNPTSIVQKAAVAALQGQQEYVAEMQKEYIVLRDHVVNGLRSIPGVKCTKRRGLLCLSQHLQFFRSRRRENGIRLAGKLFGRRMADRARRRIWNQRPHQDLLCYVVG